jgi:hypothetical protein
MRRSIIFLIFILGLAKTAKADTIDFWHVYYNKTKIREFNLYGDTKFKTIVLRNIQQADFIVVKYFRDTPCSDCLTTLYAENEKQERVSIAQGKGTFNPVTLPLKDIFEHQKRTKHAVFDVYYFEGKPDNEKNKQFLFRIKLK